MKYTASDDTLYEIANIIFDEEVLKTQENFDRYNDEPSPFLARDELYEIIGEMCDAAEMAMVDCARENRERFFKVLDAVDRRTA